MSFSIGWRRFTPTRRRVCAGRGGSGSRTGELERMSKKPKPMTPDGLGPHVKSLRTVRRLTQDELAERSGLAADTIRRLEHEEFSPSLRTLKKVARGLKVTLVTLISTWAMSDS